jgi:hypothetical protein
MQLLPGRWWRSCCPYVLVRRGCDQVRNLRISACRLPLDTRQTVRPTAVTLCALSAFAFFRGCHARHSNIATTSHRIASHPSRPALTLVLRSTHSSQLNVGLLRFCFFLAGWSIPCALPSGDVDGCASSIVRTAARAIRVRSLHPLAVVEYMQCDTGSVVLHGCHALCSVSGIS